MNVTEAFSALKTNLEITDAEQDLAKSRHVLIRDHIRSKWTLDDDFLTGSYARHTKTKRLKDVDIFIVLDPAGPQAHLRTGSGTAALAALADVLGSRWTVETDTNVVRVRYADEAVASYEVAPAFGTANGYVIPNGDGWMATNPKIHHDLVTKKNKDCDGKFVPFIKMVKSINREAGEPIHTSFLFEVMGLELVDPPFLSYPDEIRFFLASAADQIGNTWADPAGLGEAVNASMTTAERERLASVIRSWQHQAEYAIRLAAMGDESGAIRAWRQLFGSRMPAP